MGVTFKPFWLDKRITLIKKEGVIVGRYWMGDGAVLWVVEFYNPLRRVVLDKSLSNEKVQETIKQLIGG